MLPSGAAASASITFWYRTTVDGRRSTFATSIHLASHLLTVSLDGSTYVPWFMVDAARRGLFEIDRTLDVLTFSDFGRCRYLPVGFVVSPRSAQGIAFTETYPPLPLAPSSTARVMTEPNVELIRRFVRHSEHYLRCPPESSESETERRSAIRARTRGSTADSAAGTVAGRASSYSHRSPCTETI